jgi:ADP-heptose:LPS heptosyltransferase
MLAAGLAECDILITNDSGPLHLAAAAGTRTLSLWGAGDPAETGVRGAAHTLLRHPELPCVPCVRNECPRHGAGYVLPEAERECLQLIRAADVLSAVHAMAAP